MKRIFILAGIVLALVATSCGKPKFRFVLDVNGDVVDSKTEISAVFDANVRNVTDQVFNCYEILDINCEDGKDAMEWAEGYIKDNFLKGTSNEASYSITTKGYIMEESTGLRFSIDKTWTNRSEDPKLKADEPEDATANIDSVALSKF